MLTPYLKNSGPVWEGSGFERGLTRAYPRVEYLEIMAKANLPRQRSMSGRWLWMMVAFLVVGLMGANTSDTKTPSDTSHAWTAFSFMSDPSYNTMERVALIANVVIALAGLGYALMLVNQVYGQDTGTTRMQEIARAVREGADAYLRRQLTTVGLMIIIITGVLIVTKWPWDLAPDDPTRYEHVSIALGRGIAFLIGSIFSATVGFVGMRLATAGNLRVAAAAKQSFGQALQIGYRTGTITGMLTDGLGLLGGSLIFLYFGERAYEALLGLASAAPCWLCSCAWAAASTPRPPTSVPTLSARSRPTSPKTTRAMPPPLLTTLATTSATAPAWPRTSSKATK
jgi:hypothetical protein